MLIFDSILDKSFGILMKEKEEKQKLMCTQRAAFTPVIPQR